jgi:hypothetical protein
MAAIASIVATGQIGAFNAAEATLTASDTITIAPGKEQLLVLRNGTAGSLTATVDGDAGTTANIPGLGSVSVAAGYPVVLAAGESKAVRLSSISLFCQGTVYITGGTGLKATLFDI